MKSTTQQNPNNNKYPKTRKDLSRQQQVKEKISLETGAAQQQANTRITNYLKTISKLQNTLTSSQAQVSYYRSVLNWINSMLDDDNRCDVGGVQDRNDGCEGRANGSSISVSTGISGSMGMSKTRNSESKYGSVMKTSSHAKLDKIQKQTNTYLSRRQDRQFKKDKQVQQSKPKQNQFAQNSIIKKDNIKNSQHTSTNNADNPKQGCRVEKHLKYILEPDQQNATKSRIEQLIIQRNSIYNKIKKQLQKQEPYLHDKILYKIQREVKQQLKLEAIRTLQGMCAQKQKWVKMTEVEMNQAVDQKSIEKKVASNLMRMKQIMGTKINNDDYIAQFVNNTNLIDRNVSKINKSVAQLRTLINQQLQIMSDQHLQLRLHQMHKQKVIKSTNVEVDANYLQQLDSIMQEGYQLLSEPLSPINSTELQAKYQELNKQVMEICHKKY